jgi:phage N-6-adenine-methyltransferase
MSNSVVLIPMTGEKARTCVNTINQNFNNNRFLLLDLYEREGWKALGYDSWRECVKAEFLQSQSHLYELLGAAKVERNLSAMAEIGTIPERQLRPLTSFDSQTQRDIWNRAKETAPEGKITASHIEQVSREFKNNQEEIVFESFDEWANNPNPPYEVEEEEGKLQEPGIKKAPALVPLQSQSMKLLTRSENDSWRTPAHYIEAAREVLNGIDLDPASSEIANQTVKAMSYFTKEDDGLAQPWIAGTVWINPPYGKTNNMSNQGLFAQKLVDEYEAGNVGEGIILVNHYHGYNWFAPLDPFPFCRVNHRISFVNPETNLEGDEAKASSVFVYVGKDPRKFYRVFKQFGRCGQLSDEWD